VRVISGATSRKRLRSQSERTVAIIGVAIQKCPEVDPPSPLGAYDGRPKCASGEYVPGSVDSLTTPSSFDEEQAESRHPITKEITPHKAARFFTDTNVPIAQLDATVPS